MFQFIKDWLYDRKQKKRGYTRVVDRKSGIRGRVYSPIISDNKDKGNNKTTKPEPVANLTMKVTRTDGSVETIKQTASIRKI